MEPGGFHYFALARPYLRRLLESHDGGSDFSRGEMSWPHVMNRIFALRLPRSVIADASA